MRLIATECDGWQVGMEELAEHYGVLHLIRTARPSTRAQDDAHLDSRYIEQASSR